MGAESRTGDTLMVGVVLGVAVIGGLSYAGGALSAAVAGDQVPTRGVLAGLAAWAHPSDPGRAWHGPVGPWPLYWTSVVVVFVAAAGLGFLAWRLLSDSRSTTVGGATGFASRAEISRVASSAALMRRAVDLRPSLAKATVADLGVCIGRARGLDCWASVEDSLVVLGPPRSGKGLHVVIPAILDAPGAVVTTSTRPDNLAATIERRRERGPVAVFDPQRLGPDLPGLLRWSPIRGCEVPATAMARGRALCADPGPSVENASFWAQQAYTAVRCLLHAAALGRRQPIDLVRWSLSALAAEEAVDILRSDPRSAPAWATALSAILSADPRQRDSTWAMVGNTFAPLADPGVLDAVSPGPAEQLDPTALIQRGGTLYLLGTATGASASANLVSALIEDIVDTARRAAAASPGSRVEPPLALVLDEAANYPLPSLLPMMSEGGGSGISTIIVLQSLAQARAKWGHQEAAAAWDAAVVKVVLGGSANADDLRDLSALIGTRQQSRLSHSWGAEGRRSTSESTQEVPVLAPGDLRTLPFGSAILLLRSAAPIRLRLRPWTSRKDAPAIRAAKSAVEARLRAPSIRAEA